MGLIRIYAEVAVEEQERHGREEMRGSMGVKGSSGSHC